MTKYHVGQEVTYFTRPDRGIRATVTRLGRKWGHIEVYGREVPFDLETGQGKDQYGYGDWINTDEELAAQQARSEAMARVKSLQQNYGNPWSALTVDQINRIADIIEETA